MSAKKEEEETQIHKTFILFSTKTAEL